MAALKLIGVDVSLSVGVCCIMYAHIKPTFSFQVAVGVAGEIIEICLVR